MISFVEILTEAMEREASILHQYLLNAGKHSLAFHAFVEGLQDRAFFSVFLDAYLAGRAPVYWYVCGNKRSVLFARGVINPELRAEDFAMYFVDKDLDDLIPPNHPQYGDVYVTDAYSIENYLVSEKSVELVWAEHYRQGNGAVGDLIGRFRTAHSKFLDIGSDISAWAIHHRRAGRTPQVSNIKLGRVVRVSSDLGLDVLLQGGALESALDEACGVATAADWGGEKEQLEGLVRSMPRKAVVRGKFELWFLIEFLRAAHSSLSSALSLRGSKLRVAVHITSLSAVSILGPRVEIPASLKQFLDGFFGSHGLAPV